MTDSLHIFALKRPDATRHTHLTRTQGERPDLPPLAEWLGVKRLDTGKVELFPVADLGGMPLSGYVVTAFDADSDALGAVAGKLDAVTGSVLLVPSSATEETPEPGPEVEWIATVPQTRADHAAQLPRADVTPAARREPAAPASKGTQPTGIVPVALALVVVIALVIWWIAA